MIFGGKIKIPVEVSARHCHLSKEDLEKLFGFGYELKKMRQISQPSDFASEEKVDIQVGDKKIKGIRIVGPLRKQTQVEVSLTDAFALGTAPKIRLSGDLKNSSPVAIVGPKGIVKLNEGLIVALRHIHCSEAEAAKLGLKNGQTVDVEIRGDRPIIFENVLVRVKDGYKLSLHLDTDEANAAGIDKIGEGIIL